MAAARRRRWFGRRRARRCGSAAGRAEPDLRWAVLVAGGEEKTTRRWLGGAVAGSVSVATVEGDGGGRQSRGWRSILRLDAFQSQKAMNRHPNGPTGLQV